MPKLSPEQMRRRRGAYWRACLRRDQNPADPVVLKLFHHLQLAWWGQQNSAKNREAEKFERQTWDYLMRYFTTLERPDLRSFDRLG